MKSLLLIAIGISLLFGCYNNRDNSKDDEFYTTTKTDDLWRVPLIKPYELVSPTDSDLNDWFLIVDHPHLSGTEDFTHSGDEFQFTSIQRIGIKDSIIVITNDQQYWPLLSGQYPSTLIINAKTDELFIYSNTHHVPQIESKMKELKVETIELLNWTDVKLGFQEKKRLPKSWRVR